MRPAITIKTILVAASGRSATGGAVDLACRLARRLHAHLEGYHAVLDAEAALAELGQGAALTLSGTITETMWTRDGSEPTKPARYSTRSSPVARLRWTSGHIRSSAGHRPAGASKSGYALALVASRARFFDLAVLGRSGRAASESHSDTVEQVLTISGQPVLLALCCGADLLVMGGYDHSPWREAILGGATREALSGMTMPLLLMH